MSIKSKLKQYWLYLLVATVAMVLLGVYSYYFTQAANLLALYTGQTAPEAVQTQYEHFGQITQVTQTAFTWAMLSLGVVAYFRNEMPPFKTYFIATSATIAFALCLQGIFLMQLDTAVAQKLTIFGITFSTYVVMLLWYALLYFLSKQRLKVQGKNIKRHKRR